MAVVHSKHEKVRVSRYPFSVVYRIAEHSIEIVAVAHAKRKPGYWASRVD